MIDLIFANPISNALSPLINLLDSALQQFNDWGIPWGWGIILLTVIVRVLLLPLTYKQVTSMLHMQQYQPQIKELGEKYKDDPQRKQQELMKFFKEHKINPLASCFPLLLQMPFFLAMFYALRDPGLQAAMGNSGWFFITDLTKAPVMPSVELAILLVLYVGSQLGSTLVSLTPTTDAMQRKLMLALPFLFIPMIINFPAGLILYWITTNFWTFGQSFVVRWMRIRQGDPVLVSGGDEDSVVVSGAAAVVEGQPAAKKPTKAPPPPPRQKKKRSGRRR
jgi:YidC/Oxa1 family membrane protein insertase